MTSGTRSTRRGAMLVVVVVVLMVLSMIFSTLIRRGLSHRSLIAAETRRIQAALLAESGLDRARALIANRPDAVAGEETWKITAEQLDGRHPASVLIRIEPVDAAPAAEPAGVKSSRQWKVTARADYPAEVPESANASMPARARVTRFTVVSLGEKPSS